MQIVPATLADAPDFGRIHRVAFGPGRILSALMPPDCPPAALRAFQDHTAARVRLYLSLPDKRLFKAVIDGRTVGWTWWDVPYSGPPVVMPPRTFPEGTRNIQVAIDFFQRMAANAPPMPCYALEILAVDPEYQRRGIGKALVQWGIDKAAEEGLECHLDATVEGVPLYKAIGFIPRGESVVASDGSFEVIPMVKMPPAKAKSNS